MDTSPSPIPPQKTTAFAHQAAKASWASAVIVFFLVAFGGRTGARVILELVALFLIVAGLVLGIIALFGIRKHGMKGILAPALVGMVINGLMLFIFVTNFVAARARAQRAGATGAVGNDLKLPGTRGVVMLADDATAIFVGFSFSDADVPAFVANPLEPTSRSRRGCIRPRPARLLTP